MHISPKHPETCRLIPSFTPLYIPNLPPISIKKFQKMLDFPNAGLTGRSPQFSSQQEFDAFMESDIRQWRPDIQALLSDGTKVYFEVKRFLSDFSSERVSAIWQILQSETKSYVVLTTGYYYEIHVSRRKDSLKIIHVPTIEEIINWERGLN